MARDTETDRHTGRAVGDGVPGKRKCGGERRYFGFGEWVDVCFRRGRRFVAWHSTDELARICAESRLGLPDRQEDCGPCRVWLVVQPGNVWLDVWPQCNPKPASAGLSADQQRIVATVRFCI